MLRSKRKMRKSDKDFLETKLELKNSSYSYIYRETCTLRQIQSCIFVFCILLSCIQQPVPSLFLLSSFSLVSSSQLPSCFLLSSFSLVSSNQFPVLLYSSQLYNSLQYQYSLNHSLLYPSRFSLLSCILLSCILLSCTLSPVPLSPVFFSAIFYSPVSVFP